MTLGSAFVIAALTVSSPAAQQTKAAESKAEAQQAKREAALMESMSNVVLVGRFTMDGDEQREKLPKPERYEIKSVKKLKNSKNVFVFNARAKWGKFDQTLPFQLKVMWAGETPVVTMDDQSLWPMPGKFSCRVVFHGDRYVGTWQHDKVGGHMFGRIERPKEKVTDAAKDSGPDVKKQEPTGNSKR